MPRYPSRSTATSFASFGPGPLSTAMKALIGANVAMFLVQLGASGAIYGLLLAYALYFPDRPIYMYFLFPVPAKIFVAIVGLIAFYASVTNSGGGVANATHLGGLLVAYVFLKGSRINPLPELK